MQGVRYKNATTLHSGLALDLVNRNNGAWDRWSKLFITISRYVQKFNAVGKVNTAVIGRPYSDAPSRGTGYNWIAVATSGERPFWNPSRDLSRNGINICVFNTALLLGSEQYYAEEGHAVYSVNVYMHDIVAVNCGIKVC